MPEPCSRVRDAPLPPCSAMAPGSRSRCLAELPSLTPTGWRPQQQQAQQAQQQQQAQAQPPPPLQAPPQQQAQQQAPLPEGWRGVAPLHSFAEPEGLSDWPAGLPADWRTRGLPRRRVGALGAARARGGEMPEPHLRAARRALRDGGEMPGPPLPLTGPDGTVESSP